MKQQVKKAIAEAEDAGGPPSAWDGGVAQPTTEESGSGLAGEFGSSDGGGASPLLLMAVQRSTESPGESRGNTGRMDSGESSDGGQCSTNLIADIEASYFGDSSDDESS